MKRIFALLLALLLALSLSSCGGQTGETSVPTPAPATDAPSAKPKAPSAEPDTTAAAPPEASAPAAPFQSDEEESGAPAAEESPAVTEDGRYSSKDEVALYIHLYGHLPDNYVTKREAQDMGWSGGSVEQYAGEGAAIGGSRFGNYEGLLPEAEGRSYTECDIDTVGSSSRGAKRIVFSNDGLIYYTDDHYQSFELLYGEP